VFIFIPVVMIVKLNRFTVPENTEISAWIIEALGKKNHANRAKNGAGSINLPLTDYSS